MSTKFQKGKSGNPAGKPKGCKDKRTELRQLLQPHAKDLLQKAVDLALDGDQQALRLCIDRLVPALKPTVEPVNTGLVATGLTLAQQAEELYRQAAAGEIDLDTADGLMKILQGRIKIDELTEITQRLEALEAGNGKS